MAFRTEVSRSFNALLGLSVRYALIPATTGAGAKGVTLTPGAGAWGAYANLAAAKAIVVEFWITEFIADTPAGFQVWEIQVANVTPVVLDEFRYQMIQTTAVGERLTSQVFPVQPYPIWMAANALVQARAGGAAAVALNVTMRYATLL